MTQQTKPWSSQMQNTKIPSPPKNCQVPQNEGKIHYLFEESWANSKVKFRFSYDESSRLECTIGIAQTDFQVTPLQSADHTPNLPCIHSRQNLMWNQRNSCAEPCFKRNFSGLQINHHHKFVVNSFSKDSSLCLQ